MAEDQQQRIRQLLDSGQRKAEQGDPAGALQDLIQILQSLGYSQRAFEALVKARSALAGCNPNSQQATDEVLDLLSRCNLGGEEGLHPILTEQQRPPGLAEQQRPPRHFNDEMDHDMQGASAIPSCPSSEEPILQASGREGITGAALADGSSYTCPHCNGIVSRDRQAAHAQLWCPGK